MRAGKKTLRKKATEKKKKRRERGSKMNETRSVDCRRRVEESD